MNVNWMMIFIAAFFEVFWVSGLKHANSIGAWIFTIISIIISFSIVIMAGKKLPIGTVYAVFVGLGTAGTVVSEMLFFGEPVSVSKILLIVLLLIGIIGLKLVTKEQVDEGSEH